MSSDSAPATISDSASPTVQPVLAGTPVEASSTDAVAVAVRMRNEGLRIGDGDEPLFDEFAVMELVGGIRTTDAVEVGDVVVGLPFLDEREAVVDDDEPAEDGRVEGDDAAGDDEEDGPEVGHGALLSGAEEVVDGGVEMVDDVAGGDDEAGGDDAGDEDGEELGVGVLDDGVVSQSGRVTNDQVGWNWESSDEPWSVFVARSEARLSACL
jgi:hypothetical protein